MSNRFFLSLIGITLFALPAIAGNARMLRVLAIEDERTIVVDAGAPRKIQLAGIVITDREAARRFLDWALASAWVTGEPRPDGYFVRRSPDAMFVNRELVVRGYARGTSPDLEPPRNFSVTYLGEINPPLPSRAAAASVKPESDSGKSAPRKARRSRQPRPPTRKSAAPNR